MEVLTKQTVEGTVATVSGKIDAMTAQALESSLSTLIKKGILCMVPSKAKQTQHKQIQITI